MTGEDRLSQLQSLLRARSDLAPPRVEAVEPEVRSGMSFLFRDAMKRGVPSDQQAIIKRNLENASLIGTFVIEWGYDVKPEQAENFRRWLLDNEGRVAHACPPGVGYKGTYAVTMSTEKDAGKYRTIWSFESLQAMQNMSEGVGDGNSDFARLLAELNRFRDRERGAPESTQVYVPAAGAHRL